LPASKAKVIKITFNLLAKQSNQPNLYLGNMKDFFCHFLENKTLLSKLLKLVVLFLYHLQNCKKS